MKQEKILTISIAAYNVEKYIARALDSLIDENIIDDLEIFVVDDGGDDGTLEIAQGYADRFPNSIFCIHKENGGYGSTINKTIEIATGKYFKQLDGDDWFYKENLGDFIKLLDGINADVILSPSDNFYELYNRYTSFNYNYVREGLYNIEKVGLHTRFSIHTVTFLTSILKGMNCSLTEHCFYTDSEFISYPMPLINTVYISHVPIYVYRIGGREEQSSTMEGAKNHYKEMEHVIRNVEKVYAGLDDQFVCRRLLLRLLMEARVKELFKFYCVLPISLMPVRNMKKFEAWLKKECPEVLSNVISESKTLKVLLDSNYFIYPLACFRVRHRWRKLKDNRS